MSMTFREKSLWLTLVGLVLTFGGYFHSVYAVSQGVPAWKDLLPHHAGLFMVATVALVVILVAGHIALAVLDRRAEPDERDRSIELRAGEYGSFVLGTGVFLALCAAVVTEGNAIMAHVLLGFWVLAEGVDIACQLILHRRGS